MDEEFVKNDKVLTYDVSYDLAYLRALEAVQDVGEWDLAGTEKEKGIIEAYNKAYLRPDAAERRTIRILVKRDGLNKTSIQIAPEDQGKMSGDKLLDAIDKQLKAEL